MAAQFGNFNERQKPLHAFDEWIGRAKFEFRGRTKNKSLVARRRNRNSAGNQPTKLCAAWFRFRTATDTICEGVQLDTAKNHAGVSLNDLTDEMQIDELTGNAAFSNVRVRLESS